MSHGALINVKYFVLRFKNYIFVKSCVTLKAQQYTGMTGFDSV